MPDVSGSGSIIEGDVIVQGGDFVAGDKHVHIVEDPAAQRERRGQRILLDKVHTFWIEGVLETNLRALGALEVRSVARPDLVAQPWTGIVNAGADGAQPAEITSLPEWFDACQRALLITGEPGSGKTTALLSLARELIERARASDQQAVPVVFHLSTWAPHIRLEDWLVAELNAKYQIPRDAARRWLLADALLLLLDGLDEVAEQQRPDCVREINRFRGEHGLVGVVVCTRLEEYQRAGELLQLGAAALLMPLQSQQIEQALSSRGDALAGLPALLADDPALGELAHSPLMLSIMAQVFATGGGAALPQSHQPVEALLEATIQAAFSRRGGQLQPHAAAIRRRLGYLARKMRDANQSIFLIENLQPSWLHPNRLLPYALLTRLSFGLLVGILYTLQQMALFPGEGPLWNEYSLALLVPPLLGGLAAGALFAIRLRRAAPTPAAARSSGWHTHPLLRRAANLYTRYLRPVFNSQSILFGATGALVLLVMNAGIRQVDLPDQAGTFILYTVVPLLVFLTYTMIYGFAFPMVNEPPRSEIDPVSAVLWSWRHARQGALAGLVVTLAASILFVMIANIAIQLFGLAPNTPPLAIVGASVIMIFILFLPLLGIPVAGIFAVLGGLRGRGVERGTQPNQGIHQSLRSARFSLVVSGLACGMIFLGQRVLLALAVMLLDGVDPLARWWLYPFSFLTFGLFIGGIAALRYGGGSVVQHYILRALLALDGVLPWKLTELLEQAVSLTLLRRAGSGYLFPHRVFLEFFAAQPEAEE